MRETTASSEQPTHRAVYDLVGGRFGRLLVVRQVKSVGKGARWLCRCDCGSTALVNGVNLRSRSTRSCGCFAREVSRINQRNNIETHGLSKHPLYGVWHGMMERCYKPKKAMFYRYGGRGITVCKRWHDVENFIRDMEPSYRPGLSLDRKDNDAAYSPENCRWATRRQQNNNKATTKTVFLHGETLTWGDAARKYGISYRTLAGRLRNGWDPQEAVSCPVGNSVNYIEYHGEHMSVVEAARRFGMKYGTLSKRLSKGWSVEKALETPVGGRGR